MKGRYNEEGRVGVVVTLGLLAGVRVTTPRKFSSCAAISAPIDTADSAKSVPI